MMFYAKFYPSRRFLLFFFPSPIGFRRPLRSAPSAAMAKGPGLFSDIGKKAKDLLTKDYTIDQKLSLSTYSDLGVGLTSSTTRKGESSTGDLAAVYKYNDTTIEAKVDTGSNISTTLTFMDVFPSTKCITTLKFPDYKSGKVELQYLRDNAAVTTAVGLNQSPVLDFTLTFGTPALAVGGEFGYDTASGTLTKYNVGIGVTKPEACIALFLAEKGDVVKASYLHHVSQPNNTIAVAELSRQLSTNENTFTFGASHALDPFTTAKAKFDSHGKLSALLQHELKPKSVITISGECNIKDLEKSPKFGLALALKP